LSRNSISIRKPVPEIVIVFLDIFFTVDSPFFELLTLISTGSYKRALLEEIISFCKTELLSNSMLTFFTYLSPFLSYWRKIVTAAEEAPPS
jgi:hypothetical protein